MEDIFDNPILCKKCNSRMKKATFNKNGFLIRAVVCAKCSHKILHPNDEEEYNKFINLRNKEFRVKMRLVGNSYAISIPKEIVSFIREQERIMNDMVRLCFEEAGRLSLNFSEPERNNIKNLNIVEKTVRAVRIAKLNKNKLDFDQEEEPKIRELRKKQKTEI